MLQGYYDGENLLYRDVPDAVALSLVDQIKNTLKDPEQGGVYHHFGATGNDWDVAGFGSATPMVFNYQGNAPADVLAAFGQASAQRVSEVIDPNGPGNNQGGSDLSNILMGVSFVSGGALLTGGSSFFSTVFNSISDAVSSVFTAAPADVAWGALDAGPAAIAVDAQAAAAYATANAATAAEVATAAAPIVNAATDAAPWGSLDAGPAAIAVDAQAAAAYATANAATIGAITLGATAATVIPSAKDAASIAASAAALTKAATSVAAAGSTAAHPMAAFTSPFVLGTGADSAAGTASPAAAPAAADPMPYAAFAIAGVILVGIYFLVLRKH